MIALFGLIFGAIFGVIFSVITFDIGPIHFNKFTWPGYSIFTLILIGTFIQIFKFNEVGHINRVGRKANNFNLHIETPNARGILTCYLMSYAFLNILALCESVTSPLVTDYNHKYTDNLDWD